MKQQTLQDIFNQIGNLTSEDRGGNDKGGKIHTYLDTYEKLFSPFRKNATILEIGLALGDSLKLWDRYFQNSTIVGCDISVVFNAKDIPARDNYNIIDIIEADATKPEFLEKIKEYSFNIIIDDGSHMEADQITTFKLLKSKMKKGGVYIIEDILALDKNRHRFEALHDNCEIIDMRSNGRFDNVLIVYRF
jgi:23S rRNA U2552 (ribose-2'-O)-methylase RlmE/FtsJ